MPDTRLTFAWRCCRRWAPGSTGRGRLSKADGSPFPAQLKVERQDSVAVVGQLPESHRMDAGCAKRAGTGSAVCAGGARLCSSATRQHRG